MIRPKWNAALEDYVAMGSFANEPPGDNSPRIEIDGKKINLQISDGMVTDEIDSPESSCLIQKKSQNQRLSWMQLVNNANNAPSLQNLDQQQASANSQKSKDQPQPVPPSTKQANELPE